MKPYLSADRFKAIVSAYGADPKRWPDAERDAALRFLARNTAKAAAWIEEARELDALLDAVVEPVTAADTLLPPALAEALKSESLTVAQAMPVESNIVVFPRSGGVRPLKARRQVLPLLWTGIGLAACLAGAGLGIKVAMSSMDDVRAQTVLEQAQLDAEN
ncbi:MAG: hypothetical protein ACXU8U_04950 [Asticcacaulis sp.]